MTPTTGNGEGSLKLRLRHRSTDCGVAVDRLPVQLEQAHGQGGSLNPALLHFTFLP